MIHLITSMHNIALGSNYEAKSENIQKKLPILQKETDNKATNIFITLLTSKYVLDRSNKNLLDKISNTSAIKTGSVYEKIILRIKNYVSTLKIDNNQAAQSHTNYLEIDECNSSFMKSDFKELSPEEKTELQLLQDEYDQIDSDESNLPLYKKNIDFIEKLKDRSKSIKYHFNFKDEENFVRYLVNNTDGNSLLISYCQYKNLELYDVINQNNKSTD